MTLLPTTAMAATPKNDAEIQERIDELIAMFSGKYFTVNQGPCLKDGREKSHGCENCNTTEIVKAKWFKERFGNVKTTQFQSTGKSCVGFAWFAEWYIFRENNQDSVKRKEFQKMKFTYDELSKYAKKGDLVSVGGHSFILISYDETGVRVLDSNWKDLHCKVFEHRIKYTNSKYKNKECKVTKCYSVSAGKSSVVEEKDPGKNVKSTLSFSLPAKSYPEGTIQKGKSFVLKGTIASNYKITYVKGEIIDSKGKAVQAKEIKNGKSKTVPIQSSILNKQLKFGTLPAGTYTLKYTAKDSSGNTVDISKVFTVGDKNAPATPTTPTTPSEPAAAKQYTITLNAQGGSVSKKSIQVEEGKSYGNLPRPTRNGYHFVGWFIDASCTGKALTAGTKIPAKDHTIYAKWEREPEEAIPAEKPEQESKPIVPESAEPAVPNCNGKHTKGAFVRTENEHPHPDIYKCKICGEQFAAESTKCISDCKVCNPGKQLIKAPAAKVIMNTGETLKNGSSGDNVKRLQMNLNTMGFKAGTADGKFGNNTKDAVKSFQKEQGLEADGIAGKKTLTRMVDIAVDVQTHLYQLGYFTEKIDGVMGSKTQSALKAFQKDYGLKQDGIATASVRNALAKAVS